MLKKLILLVWVFLFLSILWGDGNTKNIISVSKDSSAARVFKAADSSSDILEIRPTGSYLGKGELREPLGISVGPRGSVYVADAMAGKVFKYNRDGSSIEFENPSSLGSVYPIDLAGSAAFLYLLDYAHNRVLRYDYRGAYLDILINFGEYDNLKPVSLSLSPGGRFLVTDIEKHTLTILGPSLDIEIRIGAYGWSKGYFNEPMKAVILPGGRIAVADSGNKRIQIFSAAGGFLMVLGYPEKENFCSPRSICGDAAGNIFVADAKCGEISVFSASGRFITKLDSYSGRDISPAALSVGLENRLYVADIESSSVIIYLLVYPDNRP